MKMGSAFGMAALTAAAIGGMVSTSQAAPARTSGPVVGTKVSIPVVAGAKKISAVEKFGVVGLGDCPPPPCPPPPPSCPPPAPVDSKPGYGFGTTGHYGPPGQGFTPGNSWRMTVAAGGTTTPKGGDLPPRAFR